MPPRDPASRTPLPVTLDLYEGMIHNFQDRIHDAPEAALVRKKIRAFVRKHLDLGT